MSSTRFMGLPSERDLTPPIRLARPGAGGHGAGNNVDVGRMFAPTIAIGGAYAHRVVRGLPDPEVARLAEALRGRLDALVDELTEMIGKEIDIYGAGAPVEIGELRRSVEHNFTYMLGQLTTVEP